jgi:uncharacterized protein YndB with AHSA1/START domain
MKTLTRHTTFDVSAPPERVFPLLCPVREYDWIANWACEMVHSESGVAEEDCVFRTRFRDGPMTWTVSRHEPPTRIEFTCVVPDLYVMRLKIALAGDAALTRLEWTRRWLPLSPAGEGWIEERTEAEYEQMMAMLRDSLRHYLATGDMLRP